MEVHHHPQVTKKKFGEYVSEGLMIFLAVMLGFLAENIREGISDREKEKEYMSALLQNLKDDTLQIASVISENKVKLEGLEKLMGASHKDLSTAEARIDFYRNCGSSVSYYSIFKSNDATMQQLKNAGALRFIRKHHMADSIARYDVEMTALYEAGDLSSKATDLAILASHELLDYSVYYDSSYYRDRKFTGKMLPLLSMEPLKQQLFLNKIAFEIGATRNYLNNLEQRLPLMKRMIGFIKQIYHIENE